MSKVVEYVGMLHLLKDHVKETWTQFWANLSHSPESYDVEESGGPHNETETNFRKRIKEKLDRLKKRFIRIIDSSSNDQEDYSHLTRPKTRRELMQISAAVMGIEFSYAAETAFVSPLLLNIGLRHRHMTLIWCLSPLLGFFITPLLGSLSDGCRSQLGRRRPFIILLSIGIILGLILVPNGKTIGRMLGDTYRDDKPPELRVPSELTSHLLVPPYLSKQESRAAVTSNKRQTYDPLLNSSKSEFGEEWKQSFNDSDQDVEKSNTGDGEDEQHSELEKPSYQRRRSSEHIQTEDEHGTGAWNNHKDKDLDREEILKTLARRDKSPKINQEEFQRLLYQASSINREDEEILSDPEMEWYGNKLEDTSFQERNEDLRVTNETDSDTTVSTKKIHRTKRLQETEETGSASSSNNNNNKFDSGSEDAVKSHPWGLVFTVIGTVLLDFDADACQSPSRAYMLDVTIPEDHAKGLSTFTIMAGLGGSIGYFLGALNWENTFLGRVFGGHVRAVFTLVLFIFVACVAATIRSFREIPIDRLWANNKSGGGGLDVGAISHTGHKPKVGLLYAAAYEYHQLWKYGNIIMNLQSNPQPVEKYTRLEDDSATSNIQSSDSHTMSSQKSYGTIQETSFNASTHIDTNYNPPSTSAEQAPTFKEYVKTIVQLPRSLQWLCVTNFFCWMSLVCYSLYFTDFVGEAVFGGDPTAPQGSPLKEKYDAGVRFGCWGMSLYSLSCAIYSLCIDTLINRFGARQVYIYGQLVYSVGMVCMAIARHPAGVIIFSWTAGIMYATLFTMPYLLVARYHAAETFDVDVDDMMEKQPQVRGLGTDVAIVSSMVFLAQITQAVTLGTIVTAVGSTTAIVCAASVFAACGAVCATKVLYLDL